MRTNAPSERSWTRFARLAALVLGAVALLSLSLTAGASAQADKHHPQPVHVKNAGIKARLASLEAEQARLVAAQAVAKTAQEIAEAKLEITQQQSLYGLLFNGDGPHGPDRQKWGDQIFTGEGSFLAYDSSNNLIPSQSFDKMSDEIATAVAGQPSTWPDTTKPNGSMHYMFAPVFDSITPTTAVTRTPSMSVSAVKGTQAVNTITIRVYHDTWRKTATGWKKTSSTWYRLD